MAQKKDIQKGSTVQYSSSGIAFKRSISRREFFKVGVGAAAAAAISGCIRSTDIDATEMPLGDGVLIEIQPSSNATFQPEVITPTDGVIRQKINVELVSQEFPDPSDPTKMKTDRLRSFVFPGVTDDRDIYYPAPTFRMKRGQTLMLDVTNNLGPNDPEGDCDDTNPPNADSVYPNCFHNANTVNLHWHGSHVCQTAPGDDVFLAIQPEGGRFQYEFSVHSRQAPGTHWYHPHKHGATALQVVNGMSGAFIIEGDFDFKNPETGVPAEDLVFVVQQINTATGGGPPILINGKQNPTVKMRPNEVQRWRVIGATMQASAIADVGFQTPGGALSPVPIAHQVAQDGVQFSPQQWNPDNPSEDLDLAPGNRADYLVKAPKEPGEYWLVPLNARLAGVGKQGEDAPPTPTPPPPTATPILTVVVAEGDNDDYMQTLPKKEDWPELPDFLCPITDDELMDENGNRRQRASVFSMDRKPFSKQSDPPPPKQAPNFYVDCKQFDPQRKDHCMILGTSEEWTIYNTSSTEHPFHIHLNPFFVTDIHDPTGEAYGGEADNLTMRWQDTILLPRAASDDDPGYVIIRQRFLDFTGPFVIHCHILGHEDRGMMQHVGVVESDILCDSGTTWQEQTKITACPEVGVPNDLEAKTGTTPPSDWC